jgi:acetyltransferase-like isoleucine patch superfamily enzyme
MRDYEVIDRQGGGGGLSKGNNVKIARGVSIDITANVAIGDNVMICEDVLILTHDHDLVHFTNHSKIKRSRLTIEDDVFIGTRSIITCACNRIGRGAFIGAGSVVREDIVPNGIYIGNPATLVGNKWM